MGIENVKKFFKEKKMEERIKEFDMSSATVELAAQALKCQPERIAKTLSLKIEEQVILLVTAGDTKIDNGKYKEKFHTKAKMLPLEEVEKFTGYPVGGVCPFCTKEGVKVYLDVSLKRFETVFPSCGSRNSAIELSINEIEACINFEEWIDVCKN